MSTDRKLVITTEGLENTLKLGKSLGKNLKAGDVIELIGDVGTGKTSLVRGIVEGADISDEVASPSFTLSRIYKSETKTINHYDFYRLKEAGIMRSELEESLDTDEIVIIEWADVAHRVLPDNRLTVKINFNEDENSRDFILTATEEMSHLLIGVR